MTVKPFNWYERDVYGNPMAYPADDHSIQIFGVLRPGKKTISESDFKALEYFGCLITQVLPPKK